LHSKELDEDYPTGGCSQLIVKSTDT